MKRPITPAYTFSPGSSTLNLSGIANFAITSLFAVIDLKTGALVYAPMTGYGFTALSGTTLTLAAPMAGLAAADPLLILYDDGGRPAEDTSVQAVVSALAQNHADLVTLHTDLATTNHGDLATLHTDLAALLADLNTGLGNDTTALAALSATTTWQSNLLAATQAVTAAIRAQIDIAPLFVSDGTSTYVRRESVNEGTGTITVAFETMDGSAASPTVSALAPISSRSKVATPVYYDVVTAATGYGLTDTLAEVVITDTASGAITATWQNLTQATTLSGPPPSGNVRRSASTVSFATGQQAAANSLSVVLSSDGPFASTIGAAGDAAATSDTGPFSLMALTKRGLQRLASLIGLLPASLGQKAMTAAFPVVIASDQSAVPATIGKTATAGDASITAGGTAQTLFAGATPANGWKIANPDPAEELWISDSATAAPNGQGSFRLPAGGIITTEPGEKPCGPVSVYGATTGHVVTARSW